MESLFNVKITKGREPGRGRSDGQVKGYRGHHTKNSCLSNYNQMFTTEDKPCLLICFNRLINSRQQTVELAQPGEGRRGAARHSQPQLTAVSAVSRPFSLRLRESEPPSKCCGAAE